MSSNPSPSPSWRYLRDRDVQHAALVTVLALLLSAGLVWLGYLIHVCRVAARSPLAPPRRMVALVFGRRLERDAPEHDYRQRLRRALALAEQQQTGHLLLLGGCSGGQRSEAAAGQAWLRQHGLPGTVRLELEQDSVDSLENLRHARRLLLAEAGNAGLPPVALVTSRYHLARCLLLARRLGFDSTPVAAEPAMPRHRRYLGLLLVEASYLMWTDLGLRWAQLIGHRRMRARIS
ncbi:YdcF family protein [Rhodanobacter denitrificans]|uniref:YdcF family protein n=1 Tax=Rhodanobacter denitrificans TaxID=666685 RepID=A0A368KBV5_9GAMM|nr:YdcF family protein [Rhodanobacter denitrificans]RCS29374.1 YdcF family protein [Rhodanobacter denitrificans]